MPETLQELYEMMLEGAPYTLDQRAGGWRTDLPFWGPEWENCPVGVWSYNRTQSIRGTCNDDLEIVPRDDGAAEKKSAQELNAEQRCAHCEDDCGVPDGKGRRVIDGGGSCPVCKGTLCRRCAGGWCSGAFIMEGDPVEAPQFSG